MRFLLLVVMCLGLTGCAVMPTWGGGETRLSHVVLVWLKEPGNQAHRLQLVQSARVLAEIPGVLDVHAGSVLPGQRDVVRDDFDVGLVVSFASQEDLQTYLQHPLHLSTVKTRFAPLMARYEVMDILSP